MGLLNIGRVEKKKLAELCKDTKTETKIKELKPLWIKERNNHFARGMHRLF